jgi:hypothetical protein
MKQIIERRVFEFFVNSQDFNGIPLRQISTELDIEYHFSIDLIKGLVEEEKISIQSSTNPHIIGFRHYPTDIQLKILEAAKDTGVRYQTIGEIRIAFEETEFPICLYPSQNKLKTERTLESFEYCHYSKQLALGEPQLKPIFFDIDVLEKYNSDPRFDFEFDDYSGRISCKYDDVYNSLVRKEDEIFIKSFGIGYDENKNRVAVVFLRYLHNLTGEHQIFWKSKERIEGCRVLEDYYRNAIEGSWAFARSFFSAFLEELRITNELSQRAFDTNLFHATFEGDKKPQAFTFFFTPTVKHYQDFIHLLDKMVSENINRKFFEGKVELFELKEENGIFIKETKGTLRLLEEWLSSVFAIKGGDSISEIIKPFRDIRKSRQAPAHKISENKYDPSLIERQNQTIIAAYSAMRQLRHIFHLHPKSRTYTIPDWLENGDILSI